MITQKELEEYKKNIELLKKKEKILALAQKVLVDKEAIFIRRLEAAEGFEEGKYVPFIEVLERRSVGWKGVVEELHGVAFAERYLQTKAVVKQIKKLKVREHDQPSNQQEDCVDES